MPRKTLTIRLEDGIYKKTQTLANKLKWSRSVLVEEALIEFFTNKKR